MSFGVLGWIGKRIYEDVPPLPDRVVSNDEVAIGPGEVQSGQNVWQSLGGMELGSIWGHGSYVAPDWTADWLHREATFILDRWATDDFASDYEQLKAERKAQWSGRLTQMMRANTFDPVTGAINIDPIRAKAFQANLEHYSKVFKDGQTEYAIPAGTVTDDERLKQLCAFFWWTAWAASTDRPASDIS